MPFTPQNFVNQVGPPVSAVWLNGVDVTCNFVLDGAQTVPQALAALGLSTAATLSNPVTVAQGGTNSTTPAAALAALGGTTLTAVETAINQAFIGATLYPQTAAEIAAGVLPTNYFYPPGNVLRYGADPTGNAATATATTLAINNALRITNQAVYFPPGIYCINGVINVSAYSTLRGEALKLYPNFTTDWQTVVPSWGFEGSTIQYAAGSHGPIFSGGANSEFFGLVIRCGQVRNSSDNVWATGTEPSGIRLHGCTIQNMNYIAYNQLATYGQWQMYSNQITGCGIGAGGIIHGVLVDMLVWGNAFTSTVGNVFNLTGGAGDGTLPAFQINTNARQHVIADNVFDNHSTAAIFLNGADPGQYIAGNYFNRNGSASGATILNSCHIYLYGTGGHVIDNIYEAAAGDNGLPVTFSGNTCVVANSFNAGQPVTFASTGTLPTGITAGQTYFVSSTGLSGTGFQISASYTLGVAGTSITLSGSGSGAMTRNTLNPIWTIGMTSCIGVPTMRIGGNFRNSCATSQIIIDQYSTSVSSIRCPDALALPAGANPGNANDDFEVALEAINTVCCKGTRVELYENRQVNSYNAQLMNIDLVGRGATAPTLTNNSGAMGFASMDNINYGSLVYTTRRGLQYANATPNGFNTQGYWSVGDTVWNTAPASGGAMAWVLTTIGSPNIWTTLTLN
jgi:hypothetical protein